MQQQKVEASRPMTVEECVHAFLKLVMTPPAKPPKTQRAQRDDKFTIHGFTRGQETLRDILAHHGATDEVKALGEVRADGQERPMKGPGGGNLWIVP